MTATARLGFAVTLVATSVVPLLACKKAAPPPPERLEGEQVAAPPALARSTPPLAPARCVLGEVTQGLGDTFQHPIETGEAIPVPQGFAFGYLAPVRGGTQAGVAVVSSDLLQLKLYPIRPGTLGPDGEPPHPSFDWHLANAPPNFQSIHPLVVARDGDAFCARAQLLVDDPKAKSKTNAPAVDGGPRLGHPALALGWGTTGEGCTGSWNLGDEVSPDPDVAVTGSAQVVAFVADSPTTRRGIIAVASVEHPATRFVSSPDDDADTPRLARRGDGAWLVWLAHRPERNADPASPPASERLEAPAQIRQYAWGQILALDADGAPVGSVRDLTSPRGHAGDLELAPLPTGALDVLLREDDEAHEGEGGKVLRVRVGADLASAPAPPLAVVEAGVGRGSISLLLAPSGDGWLAYDDVESRTRLVPLDEGRVAQGPASVEPAFEGGRPLFAAGSEALVGVFPDDARPLRAVTCRRAGPP